jgi:hypothetical protein
VSEEKIASLNSLAEMFQEINIKTEEERVVDDPSGPYIDCWIGDIWFRCYLIGNFPLAFVKPLALVGVKQDDPLQWVNTMNSNLQVSSVHVRVDDDGIPVRDEDGDLSAFVTFKFLVQKEFAAMHLGLLMWLWCEDLYQVMGIEVDDEYDFDFDEMTVNDEVRNLSIVDQIEWVLGVDSVPRTARQLAGFLMKERQEINRTLYANPDKFVNDNMQPPRWTTRPA